MFALFVAASAMPLLETSVTGLIVIIVTVYRVDRTQYRGRSRNDSQ